MYEHRHQTVLSRGHFFRRMAQTTFVAGCLVLASLALGVLGYHEIGHLSWIDSILNASMILTGMGPVNPMQTVGAKLFASAYALFSGVVFLTSAAVFVAPMAHRLLHKFYLAEEDLSPRTRK